MKRASRLNDIIIKSINDYNGDWEGIYGFYLSYWKGLEEKMLSNRGPANI